MARATTPQGACWAATMMRLRALTLRNMGEDVPEEAACSWSTTAPATKRTS